MKNIVTVNSTTMACYLIERIAYEGLSVFNCSGGNQAEINGTEYTFYVTDRENDMDTEIATLEINGKVVYEELWDREDADQISRFVYEAMERFGNAANTADAEAFETAKFGFSELLADLDEDLKEDLINL